MITFDENTKMDRTANFKQVVFMFIVDGFWGRDKGMLNITKVA
jgi:hypothetical protein